MRYYGGKNHIFRLIINLIPQHDRFVELFAGSAAVSRNLARRNAEALACELDPEQAAQLRTLLPGHRVLQEDGIALLERNLSSWSRETVLFADPPYPLDDRRDPRPRYNCEMTDEQHRRLIRLLRASRARVLVCGHPWGIYAEAFPDWKRHEFRVILRSGKPGIECVWTNFTDPFPLHDYSFWGPDKRVRQDLRRQVARQLGKFSKMDRHVRAAVLRELVERFGELLGQAPPPTSTPQADPPSRTSTAEAPPSAASAAEGALAALVLDGEPAAARRRRSAESPPLQRRRTRRPARSRDLDE